MGRFYLEDDDHNDTRVTTNGGRTWPFVAQEGEEGSLVPYGMDECTGEALGSAPTGDKRRRMAELELRRTLTGALLNEGCRSRAQKRTNHSPDRRPISAKKQPHTAIES